MHVRIPPRSEKCASAKFKMFPSPGMNQRCEIDFPVTTAENANVEIHAPIDSFFRVIHTYVRYRGGKCDWLRT